MQAFALLNTAGCNIGNFALPFAQSFLGPVGTMAVCLFDAGNSIICLGGSYGIAQSIKSGRGLAIRPILAALSHSVPLITYIIMTILSALKLSLPDPVQQYAEIVSNANAFLAMLMIGVGFQLSLERSQLTSILRIIATRYITGLSLALLSYNLLPLRLEYRQALVILFLSPIAAAAPAFTELIDGDYGIACAANSVSILVSIMLIVSALLLML